MLLVGAMKWGKSGLSSSLALNATMGLRLLQHYGVEPS